ncbi:MAG: hypothetical protein JNK92_08725 [Dechloromonas sp.]|nr:hypothetical protein [Dechloromonas sp.]
MDTLTILGCKPDRRTTKTHRMREGQLETQNFNAGMFFDCRVWPVENIHQLSVALSEFERLPVALVIRGVPQPHVDPKRWHQRTKNNKPANYLTPIVGHHHVMIDIDKLALPSGLEVRPGSVQEVIAYVITQLPDEFHHASFHWQLSSSAGLRNLSVVSIHLWFWLAKPTTDHDLKRWGNAVNKAKGYKLIDTRLFDDVQPHFIAAPIFEGMDDPFPERSGLVEKSSHEVDLVLLAEAPLISRPRNQKDAGTRGSSQAKGSSGHGFDHKLSQIGDHEGGEGFHGPIISAIASYVATVGRDNVDTEWLLETVRNRVLEADSTQHEATYIDIKASREYLMSAIDGAIEKYGDAAKKRSRVTRGVPPHFRRSHTTVASARKRVSKILKRIF